jgi:phosphatidyl-myo-inositol dimannoside synthase
VKPPEDVADIVVLTTDAFGGHGGIAKYNRDFITALASYEGTRSVTVLPRLLVGDPGLLPPRVDFVTEGCGSRTRYVRTVARTMFARRRASLVVCGHIHLLPIALVVSRYLRAPLALMAYGIEVWQRPRVAVVRRLLTSVNAVVSISEITLDRFRGWARLGEAREHILPNAVDLSALRPGPKNPELEASLGLAGKSVIMTFGRLESRERYKGFDEVIQIMPRLLATRPDLTYIVAGDGSDRARLEAKVASLGISASVRFTGMLREDRKADYLRLADAFIMPSRGEGFGFVLLEAMACGIPVVASREDGGREAVRNGALGGLVDPSDPEDLERAIWQALAQPRGVVPEGLKYFEFARFEERTHALLRTFLT